MVDAEAKRMDRSRAAQVRVIINEWLKTHFKNDYPELMIRKGPVPHNEGGL